MQREAVGNYATGNNIHNPYAPQHNNASPASFQGSYFTAQAVQNVGNQLGYGIPTAPSQGDSYNMRSSNYINSISNIAVLERLADNQRREIFELETDVTICTMRLTGAQETLEVIERRLEQARGNGYRG